MTRVYIDFDSTLYDTNKIRRVDKLIAELLQNSANITCEEAEREVENCINELEKFRPFEICKNLEKKYGLKANALREGVEEFLACGKKFVFEDSTNFLKEIAQKGYEVNILTYTNKSFDYQMLKIVGSEISSFVDNIIICSKHKGSLNLDYENSYFIDDNPVEIKSLFDAGVKKDRLIRMRRDGAIYSKIKIDDDICTEVKNFNEINWM